MINTHQTSLELVPPRLRRSDSVFTPAPLPSQCHGKSFHRILVGVVSLHVFLSVGGFIFLFYKDGMQLPSSEKQETTNQQQYKALARMVVEPRSHTWNQKSRPGYLQWDPHHSVRRSINCYRNSWLTILQPGDYYIYSRVTFFKGDIEHSLVSWVMLRKNETVEDTVVMQAYCNLHSDSGAASTPRLCTVTQGEVIPLETGNQLSVRVLDLSLVNYEEAATAFGLYKL